MNIWKRRSGLCTYMEKEEWVVYIYGKGGVGCVNIRKRRSGLGEYTEKEEWVV